MRINDDCTMTIPRSECVPPTEEVLTIFWEASRQQLGSAHWEQLAGPRINSSLRPPAVQLAEDRQLATDMAISIREGSLRVLESPLQDFGDEELEIPSPGDLMIVCDGDGMPLALVSTRSAEVVNDMLVENLVTIYPVPAEVKK